MPEFQTVPQDLGAILRGNGKLELSVYQASPSWVDCGVLSGLEVDEPMEVSQEENDNADSDELVTKQERTVKANLHEALRAAVWDILRGGFDTKTVIPDDAVSGAVLDFAANTTDSDGIFLLTGQNGAGTKQTIASVSQDPLGTPEALVDGNDYVQVKDAAGRWGIKFIAGAGYDATKLIRVTYGYTPAESVKYQSGNKSVLPWFMARITTKNDGKPYYTILYKCKIRTGKKETYAKDSDKDRRMKAPIEFVAKQDALYHPDTDGVGYVYETVQTDGF